MNAIHPGAQPASSNRYDAIVVGAGVAGLYTLYHLREAGKKVVCLEAGGGVAGTWYWNRYPGARVDSQAYIYQYFFSEEVLNAWRWDELFPAQPETERYLNFVADTCDLRKDIRLNTHVDSATWDEATQTWHITTAGGAGYEAKYFIGCVGMLSAALKDPCPGRENFKGLACHTSAWPHAPVDFAGKRVGVVGTGATGIQVIQTVAPLCGHLTVFQRTPQYSIPMRNPKLTAEDNAAYRRNAAAMRKRVRETFAGFHTDLQTGSYWDRAPEERNKFLEQMWAEGSLCFVAANYAEVFIDEKVNAEVTAFVVDKMRKRINNPELEAKLIPTTFGFGTRRVPLDTGYLEAYGRDNVELVDVSTNPLLRITENGLQLASGKEYPLDILVFATGFDGGSGAFTRIDIRGRDGQTLKDYWDKDLRTTLGLQVHGFPNFFTTGAPLAPSAAFCNMQTCLCQQADWIIDTIKYLDDRGLHAIEPSAEREAAWVKHHDEIANSTLFPKTKSWYMGTNVDGKTHRLVTYLGGDVAYQQACDEAKQSGYQGFILT